MLGKALRYLSSLVTITPTSSMRSSRYISLIIPKANSSFVPKPLLRCLGCVLRVAVLLEGEPSTQSEVLSALEQVFITDLSVLCSFHLSLDPDQSPSPCH